MRDIKFRAWDKYNKKMIQSENILNICFVRTEHTPNLIACTNRKINYFEEIREQDKKYCNEFELLQYTGIKDKKGKEIYDGDIIYWSCDNFKENVVVFWDDEHLRWSIHRIENKLAIDCLYEYSDSRGIEVIGNVYENPELLEMSR